MNFHITVDLARVDEYNENQVLTADRLDGADGSFDPELVVHDAVYVSSRFPGLLEFKSVIYDDGFGNINVDSTGYVLKNNFFVQVDTRRLWPAANQINRLPEAACSDLLVLQVRTPPPPLGVWFELHEVNRHLVAEGDHRRLHLRVRPWRLAPSSPCPFACGGECSWE